MSFSMAAPPPPMPSPPLPTIALAPPPSNLTLSERRAQRQRQRATLPSPMPSTLATPGSLLFASGGPTTPDARSIRSQASDCHYVVDAPLSSLSSGGSGAPHLQDRSHSRVSVHDHPFLHHQQEDDGASVTSAGGSSVSHGSRTQSPVSVAVPKLTSPLPPQYRYPSPAPSLASSISTVASTSTCASTSSLASITSTSSTSTSGSSAHSPLNSKNSATYRRRKTITAADDPVLVIGRSNGAPTTTTAITTVVLSPSPMSPATSNPSSKDTSSASRGRGRSFSRSVRKVASVFNVLKKEDVAPIPSVPQLPAAYRS